MKYILNLLFAFLCFTGQTQNYFDIANFSYTNTPANNFEISEAKTTVEEFALEFNFPIVVNEKTIFLTGFSGNTTTLSLDANKPTTTLNQIRLNIGVNRTISDKWSATFILLPKIVSDKISFSYENLQVGLYSLFTRKKRDNLKFKFGLYLNTEEFGVMVVPIWGLYYRSANQKFETNLNMPINADANYVVGKSTWIGMNFNGLGTSYNLTDQNYTPNGAYVYKESNEICSYLRLQLSKSLFLNASIGYAINRNYEVYDSNDKVNWALIAYYFGDDRTQLNERFEDGAIFKIGLLYRIQFD
ncbi:MAG: hypothetical protein KJN66_02120 [Bacteroidia bacterium]|nr:hypothetical protein [Bacteroidia bacterium]